MKKLFSFLMREKMLALSLLAAVALALAVALGVAYLRRR